MHDALSHHVRESQSTRRHDTNDYALRRRDPARSVMAPRPVTDTRTYEGMRRRCAVNRNRLAPALPLHAIAAEVSWQWLRANGLRCWRRLNEAPWLKWLQRVEGWLQRWMQRRWRRDLLRLQEQLLGLLVMPRSVLLCCTPPPCHERTLPAANLRFVFPFIDHPAGRFHVSNDLDQTRGQLALHFFYLRNRRGVGHVQTVTDSARADLPRHLAACNGLNSTFSTAF